MEGAQAQQTLLCIPKRWVRWDSDSERMLLYLCAIVPLWDEWERMTRQKEAIVTNQLNKYLLAELFWKDSFPEKDIHLRLMQCWNGKQFYGTYKKGEMGKDLDDELELDLDAAVAARPNFKIFYENLRDLPSLGPSIVEDSAWLASTLSVDDNYRGETCCISDGACR